MVTQAIKSICLPQYCRRPGFNPRIQDLWRRKWQHSILYNVRLEAHGVTVHEVWELVWLAEFTSYFLKVLMAQMIIMSCRVGRLQVLVWIRNTLKRMATTYRYSFWRIRCRKDGGKKSWVARSEALYDSYTTHPHILQDLRTRLERPVKSRLSWVAAGLKPSKCVTLTDSSGPEGATLCPRIRGSGQSTQCDWCRSTRRKRQAPCNVRGQGGRGWWGNFRAGPVAVSGAESQEDSWVQSRRGRLWGYSLIQGVGTSSSALPGATTIKIPISQVDDPSKDSSSVSRRLAEAGLLGNPITDN